MKVARVQFYKITYPNGKIYIGHDRTCDINYFGSAHGPTIAKDFTEAQRAKMTITKEIIAEAYDLTVSEICRREIEIIRAHMSADPTIGYNRSPRGKRK